MRVTSRRAFKPDLPQAGADADLLAVVRPMPSVIQEAPAGELLAPRIPFRTLEESVAMGKAARGRLPREGQGDWQPAAGRPDPLAILEAQARTWIPKLAPIRYGRMAASPFAFFRGAAAVMAADLQDTPASGLRVQLCGDSHLGNFGFFAVPGQETLFDINDFDQTLPGPWEWDIKRLAASLQITSQSHACDGKECRAIVLAAVSAYRRGMQELAELPNLGAWNARLDMAEIKRRWGRELRLPEVKGPEKEFARARARDNVRTLEKLTVRVKGKLRIANHPPFVTPIEELLPENERQDAEERIRLLLRRACQSMPGHVRSLMERFRFVHAARKVVGVGGVGVSTWIILLAGRDEHELLFLEAREAQASVLEPYVGKSPYTPGERVAEGQRLMQAGRDIFVGWARGVDVDAMPRDFYVRRLWDWKAPVDAESMPVRELLVFGQACGWALARGHARSGDRVAIGSYLGKGSIFDQAIAQFATAYAAQNERDYQALCAAIASGRITAKMGA